VFRDAGGLHAWPAVVAEGRGQHMDCQPRGHIFLSLIPITYSLFLFPMPISSYSPLPAGLSSLVLSSNATGPYDPTSNPPKHPSLGLTLLGPWTPTRSVR
jgi:hypothetical protein